jgi:excisionase family DNA binding protein
MMEEISLPLPAVRCLSKEEAARYLGIGVTLLTELGIPFIKLGRRCLYDKVDLDAWMEEYKQREHGRAKKETLWPKPKKGSTGGRILASGGLQQRSQMAKEYARVLGLKSEKMPKHC